MITPLTLVLIIVGYIGALYAIAHWAESGGQRASQLTNSVLVYVLSIAIYCTSWTFFGSVGIATTSGILMLTIYLGPSLLMLAIWPLMQRILLVKQVYHVTSIADFLSARFNRSVVLAALASIVAMVGIVPYLALQLKAINSAINTLVDGSEQSFQLFTWLIWGGVALFTIVFGIRHLDPTERHPGMMLALAIEGSVKLVAMLVVGLFVSFYLFDSPWDIFSQLQQNLPQMADTMAQKPALMTWCSYLLLAGSAFLLLPRQFHVMVVENAKPKHVLQAQWLLPLYLFLMTVFVTPIAAAGLLMLGPENPDMYMLALPMASGATWLTLLVFVGGFSASMAMLMVSGMTLSTMFSNHIVLPFLQRFFPKSGLKRYLLQSRWLAVFVILGAGQFFYLFLGESYMLVNMGMLSFCAVLQFMPLVICGLYWPSVTTKGAIAGLIAGFLIWGYCLLLPSLMNSGWLNSSILTQGPWGIAWLRPEQLFGSQMQNISHGTFWSLIANVSCLIMVSLFTSTTAEEQRYNAEFIDVMSDKGEDNEALFELLPQDIELAPKLTIIAGIFGQYLKADLVKLKVDMCLLEVGLSVDEPVNVQELANLERATERLLSGITGASVAHMVVSQSNLYSQSEKQVLARYYRQLLTQLKISPAQLRQQLNYAKEKEQLAKQYSAKMEALVAQRTEEWQAAMDKLKRTQNQLVEHEKQASLGKMVAGIAHEINTPIGVCVTAASHMNDQVNELKRLFLAGELDEQEFVRFIDTCLEAMDIILKNNARASNLIQSFKRVAVDQSSEQQRQFLLKEYLEEVLLSLRPTLKQLPHQIVIECDADISCHTYPGALSQIVTNLIMNSILHGFKADQVGNIVIEASLANQQVDFTYRDDGVGLDDEGVKKLFDPFYTTKRNEGGSGLGAHLVYNLVTQKLQGKVEITTAPDQGLIYHIRFPQVLENQSHDTHYQI
ncbi:ATP-binding protein [Shewanella waksmanii]|uniref:ATP-binding protein n=1 Tax=Shewanella waksmanii TaxID=213783 RepID=UPI003735A7F1